MRKELKIGGLTHGGGRPEIGPFHGGPSPKGMTRIELDDTPRHISVRDVKAFKAGKLRGTEEYTLDWKGSTIFFQTDAEVREWMAQHRYRRKSDRAGRVVGTWISVSFYRERLRRNRR